MDASHVDGARNRLGVFSRGRQRLLDQDVFARFRRGDGDISVGEIGRGDGDRGDIVARQQLAVIAENVGRGITLGDFAGALLVQVADGDQFRLRQMAIDVSMQATADNARPDDAESFSVHIRSTSLLSEQSSPLRLWKMKLRTLG